MKLYSAVNWANLFRVTQLCMKKQKILAKSRCFSGFAYANLWPCLYPPIIDWSWSYCYPMITNWRQNYNCRGSAAAACEVYKPHLFGSLHLITLTLLVQEKCLYWQILLSTPSSISFADFHWSNIVLALSAVTCVLDADCWSTRLIELLVTVLLLLFNYITVPSTFVFEEHSVLLIH